MNAPISETWALDDFDPRWPAFALNPYPFYERLRREDPVHWLKSLNMWFVTSHADVSFVFSNPSFGKEKPEVGPAAAPQHPTGYERLADLQKNLLTLDPPDHTRLRALVAKAFTPRAIEALRPKIEGIVHSLLDKVQAQGQMDLVADFASPIPAIVIAEMLGVPLSDLDRFRQWTTDLVRSFDVSQPPEARKAGMDAHLALADYFEALIAERRANPQADLITELIAAEEEGNRLSRNELLATCILLLFAGYETTVNLIAVGALNLLRHPDQLALLKREPQLMADAVEELLRYESPVQRVGYYALADVELGGKLIRRGDVVLTVIGAANRDANVFEHADRLDITRKHNPHLGFGRGSHFCLGTPLARLEAQIAFAALLTRMPDMELSDPEVRWAPNTAHRRLLSLPIRFSPGN